MNFSLLIKPASSDCNLACSYCFYLGRGHALYPGVSARRMSEEVLSRTVAGYLRTPQPAYAFVWQGGEPLLLGGGFFERVTDLQMAYAPRGAEVTNALQTNATLIDDRLARQLRASRFLTGVSLDGPRELHDAARVDGAGRGTHARVMAGLDCLRRQGAEFNVLALVSRHNMSRPVEVYDYLVGEAGATFLQFIECVEFEADGRVAPYCVTPQGWGEFLCAVFDRWYAADTRRISVRLFDTVLAKLAAGRDICCVAGSDCRQYFVVEYNGDVYPCDFHVLPELRLGNVLTHAWQEMAESEVYRAFGARKRQTHAACGSCPHAALCAGDCPKNRVGHTAGPADALSYLCEGWRLFYAHTRTRFETLAETIRRERGRPV